MSANYLYRSIFKPVADYFASGALVLLLTIVWIAIFFLYLIFDETPVFFVQKRIGKNCRPFACFKFRTMVFNKEKNLKVITPLGYWLRRFSVDELPQLINVLKGEMSLVGPRPLPATYMDRFDEIQNRRHQIKPGITGWAQINGRNIVDWQQRFEMDWYYVQNMSLQLDMAILIRTIRQWTKFSEVDNTSLKEFNG